MKIYIYIWSIYIERGIYVCIYNGNLLYTVFSQYIVI